MDVEGLWIWTLSPSVVEGAGALLVNIAHLLMLRAAVHHSPPSAISIAKMLLALAFHFQLRA